MSLCRCSGKNSDIQEYGGLALALLLALSLAVPRMRPQQAYLSQQPPRCLLPEEHPRKSAPSAAARDGASTDDDGNDQGTSSSGQRLITPWISCSSQPPPPPDDRVLTTPPTPPVSLPPGFQLPPSVMLTGRSLASAQSTARCGFALTTLLLAIAKTIGIVWMLGTSNNPARQEGTPLSLLTFMLLRS